MNSGTSFLALGREPSKLVRDRDSCGEWSVEWECESLSSAFSGVDVEFDIAALAEVDGM